MAEATEHAAARFGSNEERNWHCKKYCCPISRSPPWVFPLSSSRLSGLFQFQLSLSSKGLRALQQSRRRGRLVLTVGGETARSGGELRHLWTSRKLHPPQHRTCVRPTRRWHKSGVIRLCCWDTPSPLLPGAPPRGGAPLCFTLMSSPSACSSAGLTTLIVHRLGGGAQFHSYNDSQLAVTLWEAIILRSLPTALRRGGSTFCYRYKESGYESLS